MELFVANKAILKSLLFDQSQYQNKTGDDFKTQMSPSGVLVAQETVYKLLHIVDKLQNFLNTSTSFHTQA